MIAQFIEGAVKSVTDPALDMLESTVGGKSSSESPQSFTVRDKNGESVTYDKRGN